MSDGLEVAWQLMAESNPLGDACMDRNPCLGFSDALSSFLSIIPV